MTARRGEGNRGMAGTGLGGGEYDNWWFAWW